MANLSRKVKQLYWQNCDIDLSRKRTSLPEFQPRKLKASGIRLCVCLYSRVRGGRTGSKPAKAGHVFQSLWAHVQPAPDPRCLLTQGPWRSLCLERSVNSCLCKIDSCPYKLWQGGGQGRSVPFQNQSSQPKEGVKVWVPVAQAAGGLLTAMVTHPSWYGAELCVRIGLRSGLSEHRL